MVKKELPVVREFPKVTNLDGIRDKVEAYETEKCQRRYNDRIQMEDVIDMLDLLTDTGETTSFFIFLRIGFYQPQQAFSQNSLIFSKQLVVCHGLQHVYRSLSQDFV